MNILALDGRHTWSDLLTRTFFPINTSSRRMSHKVFIASSIEIISAEIVKVCEKNGATPVHMQDIYTIREELLKARPDALFIEFSLLEGEHRNLLKEIRKHEGLSSLFIAVYAPSGDKQGLGVSEGANTFIRLPFSDTRIRTLFKRAFNLPKQVLLITRNPNPEIGIALSTMGYSVKTMIQAEDALDGELTEIPDFIISEYSLPGINGVEFAQKATESDELGKVPIILAYDGRKSTVVEEIIKSDVADVLLSPYASAKNLKKIQDRFPLPPKGRRRRALVVDDSPTISSLISSMFQELDYEVEVAENGFEGYKAVQRFQPDIITSDYDMPILNGWEFCTEVRDNKQSKDIPIIMITTRATDLDKKKGEILGVSAYLTKPFEQEKLKLVVEEAIANAKAKKEQETIAKFVAADTLNTVNNMVNGTSPDKGEDKFISLLFTDICAFSSKCERYSARKIIRLLNTYFDLMVGVLFDHDAIVDKFIGDAIVARFDSGNSKRDARNAVFAAWHMNEKLKEFNLDSFEEVKSRIGINSGNVILGNLGSQKHRLEYAMIGDNVNIGQRLESSAPQQGCMLSAATYELVQDCVHVGELQEIEVKGKSEKVKAYVLEGIQED
ncbi:MAG: response regulator [Opitutae bacterium]|nr:response regulator [Opitutae bacterium]